MEAEVWRRVVWLRGREDGEGLGGRFGGAVDWLAGVRWCGKGGLTYGSMKRVLFSNVLVTSNRTCAHLSRFVSLLLGYLERPLQPTLPGKARVPVNLHHVADWLALPSVS